MSVTPFTGTDETSTCQKAVTTAKIKLLSYQMSPFISTILYGLKVKYDPACPTLSVDGITLRINPSFFNKLEPEVRVSALAHEAWHVAFMHVLRTRLGTRDPQWWNVAADHVVNLVLQGAGYTVPNTWYCDTQYANKTAEEIYDLLDKTNPPPDQGTGQDLTYDVSNEDGDGDGTDKRDPADVEEEIKQLLIRATTNQQMADSNEAGKLPGEFIRAMDHLVNPRVPWFELLRNYMFDFKKDDYSSRRFNRRFLPDFYLPTLYSESVGRLTVGIDVSGSVEEDMFTQFMSEVYGAQELLNPDITDVISWDHGITNIHTLENGEKVNEVEFIGGGGTNVHPLLEWGKKSHPTVMVIFTDGYFSMPTEDPGYPIIWVIYDNDSFQPPFGTVLYTDI